MHQHRIHMRCCHAHSICSPRAPQLQHLQQGREKLQPDYCVAAALLTQLLAGPAGQPPVLLRLLQLLQGALCWLLLQ
jgi:hypothetical protein